MKKVKKDAYQEVTNIVVAQLEQAIEDRKANGKTGWTKPWVDTTAGLQLSFATKKPYTGINQFLLGMKATANGWNQSHWATYNAIKQAGGNVKKGEKCTYVVFFKKLEIEEKNEDGDKEKKLIPLIRLNAVFNLSQCENMPVQDTKVVELPCLAERVAHAEEFYANTGAVIKYGKQGAYYSPSEDYIGMPALESFIPVGEATATETHLGTLGHEVTHWTKKEERCNRSYKGSKGFGGTAYAKEELVAELGSVYLNSLLRIESAPREDHAKYLSSWIQVLKDDKKAIVTAAADAQKAVDFLVSLQPEKEVEPEKAHLILDHPKGLIRTVVEPKQEWTVAITTPEQFDEWAKENPNRWPAKQMAEIRARVSKNKGETFYVRRAA